MIIQTLCPECNTKQEIEVSEQGYKKWKAGTLIQNALPELNNSQREALISGICDDCWEVLFSTEDEEDEFE